MQAHPDCGMCFTNFTILYEDGKTTTESALTTHPELYPHEFSLERWILRMGYVGPMTWLVKKELFENRPNVKTVDGTFVLFASFLARTNVGCLVNDTTAVYRRLNESASHSKSFENQYRFVNGLKNVQVSLAEYYRDILPNTGTLIREINDNYYNNRRYLLLSAIVGDKEELRKASVVTHNKGLLRILLLISKHMVLRKLLKNTYKHLKRWHWFFYKKKLK